jgi:hypothetical protein
MTEKPIPFINAMSASVPELGGGSQSVMNVITRGNGSLVRRPGVEDYSQAPGYAIHSGEISAVHETLDGELYAIGEQQPERQFYRIRPGGATALTGASGSLRGTKRPVLTETQMLLVAAGGDNMRAVNLGNDYIIPVGSSAPKATHVLINKNRLVANDVELDTSVVRYSEQAIGNTWPSSDGYVGHTLWYYGGIGTAGYFTAEARPDPVVAIKDTVGELVVFGSTTTSVYAPEAADSSLIWSPVGVLETGCCAPYSPIHHRELFFWLDHRRRFVVGDGSSVKDIGQQIQSELDSLGTVDDCWGFVYQESNVVCLVWVFPTDGVAYAYQEDSGWSRWAGWTGNWSPLVVSSHHQRFAGAENIVGTTGGRVANLTMSADDDLGDTVRAYVETGYISHETQARKTCDVVSFRLRRGAPGSSGPHAFFGYRDRPGPWRSRIPIDLGVSGETEPVVRFYGLGVYRQRQWFFEFSGSERLELLGASETFSVEQ